MTELPRKMNYLLKLLILQRLEPELTVILFEKEDIITISSGTDPIYDYNPDLDD